MDKRIRGVTINTDASFCPNTKAGGYAFWIKSDYFKITGANFFKDLIIGSDDAELKCIANALHTLSKYNLTAKELEYLYINTDSTSAIGQIEKRSTELGRKIGEMIDEIMTQSGTIIRYQLRHVKGHSRNTNSRSMVNKWCDKQAGIFMRIKRKELISKKNKKNGL